MKEIILRDCKLIESLEEMAAKILQSDINRKNAEEIFFVANQLNVESLKKSLKKLM